MRYCGNQLLGSMLIVCCLAVPCAWAQSDAGPTNPGVPWPATDGLGRSLPMPDEVSPPKPNRFVGIFYFLWHNNPGGKCPHWEGPYDVSKILARDPLALSKPDSPLWGPIGMYHYWAEPLYGYYLSNDPWVLRRHAHLLADAGIDTLIFDTTNAVTYPDVYRKLCEVFQQVRQEGGHTPQIVFMVNTKAGETAQKTYADLYQPGLYRELWFHWQGKPLMICDPEKASPQLQKFFTLRRAHWPFEMVNTPYAWHWEATYPQPYGYTEDPAQPEQVNVSVAQNLRQSDGRVTNMSSGNARGRSFHDDKADTSLGAVNHGHNFQEQWQRVSDLDPPFVMVTGWNEWIAGRWGKPGGPITFVDQFDQECSRDIEPMKGGHGDNYYWQLIANVRRYKGAPPLPEASKPYSIQIDDGFEQWREVRPEFRDHVGETAPRDHAGAAGLHYTNRTGRNDFECLKVARDEQKLYFYARTKQAIRLPAGSPGMWLLVDLDQSPSTGWEGFDYLVRFDSHTDEVASLEKNAGGWQWTPAAKASYRIRENELHVAIPRSALGLAEGDAQLSIDFQWVDNAQAPGEFADFYLSGDVAPEGRFRYRYRGGCRPAPDAKQLLAKGMAFQKRGEFGAAISAYTEALQADPTLTDAYVGRRFACSQQDQWDEAIVDLTEALKRDPSNGMAYAIRGVCYQKKGDLDKAIADCTEAIHLDPDPAIYTSRAICYQEKGEHERAIADYTEAIRLDPACIEAYQGRGGIYTLLDEKGNAAATYEMVRKLAAMGALD